MSFTPAVGKRYYDEEIVKARESLNGEGDITVRDLIARLNKLPDDTIVSTRMYDYYVDELYIVETGETIWRP